MVAKYNNHYWRPTNAPDAWRHDDVWFIDEHVGWAVNSNGKIVKTENGGENWIEQLHLPGTWLRCIGFANKNVGWMGSVTSSDRLYRTLNGGAIWQRVPESELPEKAPVKICGLSVVSENVVYGSGTNEPRDNSALLKTLDGGATWTAIDMADHATLLVDNLFINENEGWVVGGIDVVQDSTRPPRRADVKPVVLYTSDGGANWIDQTERILDQFPKGEWGWKIHRLNQQTMFVALENFSAAAILRTDDGGQNWQRLEVNDQQGNVDLEGIGFVDESIGWVGGWGPRVGGRPSGVSSATKDGGKTWTDFKDVGQYLNRFRFIGDPVTVGYASGTTIYKFTDERATAFQRRSMDAAREHGELTAAETISVKLDIPDGTKLLQIRAFDKFGATMGTILREENPAAGTRTFDWDFSDEQGNQLDLGPYILRVTVDEDSSSFLAMRVPISD